jgi:hypothetical protein
VTARDVSGRLFEPGEVVPRPPGWNLIANMGGMQGWHLVDHTTPERGVVTVCGVVGRVISNETATAIVPCENCAP